MSAVSQLHHVPPRVLDAPLDDTFAAIELRPSLQPSEPHVLPRKELRRRRRRLVCDAEPLVAFGEPVPGLVREETSASVARPMAAPKMVATY